MYDCTYYSPQTVLAIIKRSNLKLLPQLNGLSFSLYTPSVLFVGENAASDQGLHCSLTECPIKMNTSEKYHQQPLKRKWTGPIIKNGKFHLA